MKGILVGGPGPTKQYFVNEVYLHYEIQKKIIDTFDTGYTDEFGLRELVANAADKMTDLKVSQEKKIMKRFLSEVTKSEKSMAVYGEHQVRKALEMGVVDTLLSLRGSAEVSGDNEVPILWLYAGENHDRGSLGGFYTTSLSDL